MSSTTENAMEYTHGSKTTSDSKHIRTGQRRNVLKKLVAMIMLGFFSSVALITSEASPGEGAFSPYVDDKGTISLPKNYRSTWIHLGTWVVPDEKAPGHGFHDVYTQPSTVEAYRKTGKYPDGAALVKEIRKIEAGTLTTGKGTWAGEITVWFVMIKDQKGRFAGNPNWGDGWGWALFEAKDPAKSISKNYKTDCLGCHTPAKGTDWVFDYGYPTLKSVD